MFKFRKIFQQLSGLPCQGQSKTSKFAIVDRRVNMNQFNKFREKCSSRHVDNGGGQQAQNPETSSTDSLRTSAQMREKRYISSLLTSRPWNAKYEALLREMLKSNAAVSMQCWFFSDRIKATRTTSRQAARSTRRYRRTHLSEEELKSISRYSRICTSSRANHTLKKFLWFA